MTIHTALVLLWLVMIGIVPAQAAHKLPAFESYRVTDIFGGAVRPPDFGPLSRYSGTDLRCFGGDPAGYAAMHVNFAGHFVIGTCACDCAKRYYVWNGARFRLLNRESEASPADCKQR